MKFRLVYEGDIFSAQRKSKENQHKIRENFHYQIKNLLESDRVHDSVKNATPVNRALFNFIPMVWKLMGAADCSLDILFLRRDGRGRASSHAGDIDNRLKTLLDASRSNVFLRGKPLIHFNGQMGHKTVIFKEAIEGLLVFPWCRAAGELLHGRYCQS